MARSSDRRPAYYSLRAHIRHIKAHKHLYPATACHLARIGRKVLDMLDTQAYSTPTQHECLKTCANEALRLLRGIREFQPVTEDESGMIEKKACDLLAAWRELWFIRDNTEKPHQWMLALGLAGLRGRATPECLERYRQVVADADQLLSQYEREEIAAAHSLRYDDDDEVPGQIHDAFQRAADRFGMQCDDLADNIAGLHELDWWIY